MRMFVAMVIIILSNCYFTFSGRTPMSSGDKNERISMTAGAPPGNDNERMQMTAGALSGNDDDNDTSHNDLLEITTQSHDISDTGNKATAIKRNKSYCLNVRIM